MPTERNRYYSAPPQTHNIANQYVWDASAIMTGANGILTGAWRALENTDFGSEVTLSGVNINLNELEAINSSGVRYLASISGSVASGVFTPSFNVLTGAQVQIPVGAKSYSIAVESGNAFVNGNLFISPISYEGGGYDKFRLATAINVGCTGGRTLVIWET